MIKYLTNLLSLRFSGLKTDEARLAELMKTLDEKLDVYNVILGKQKYVAGDVSPPSVYS